MGPRRLCPMPLTHRLTAVGGWMSEQEPPATPSCAVEVGKSYCVEAYGEPEPSPSTTSVPTSTTLSTRTSTSTSTTSTTSTQTPSTVIQPLTTTTTTAPRNGITTPTPTQATIVDNCDALYFVIAGDHYEAIASKHGITVAQFQAWDPSIGVTCTGLWANAYACVSVVGHTLSNPLPATTTTAGNSIATPTPIQPNMVGNCDLFYKVKSGDTCAIVASSNGITVQQITTWNPSVKSDCTALWLDYYICTSIVGHTPTTPGNGIQTPTPIQSGITISCKSFHFVTSGQTYQVITTRYGITQADFFKWNPAVKADCTGMWANAYVCVAVL
ncbi:lysM domain-containing protein [Colletotrichum higginsianum]|uniref:LysM domain-containing protein n=1 Tax=Colletotrichum higginsianum TaxID=80884 RepID=A0A4T0VHB4_9PEZI|nr:LysM domain-containing protein [Colletotrichum higginsianum]GJC97762.1 lysM domain-containing protein [Colletotrichum higginsianum]